MQIALLHQFLPWLNRALIIAGGLFIGVAAANWLALSLDVEPLPLPPTPQATAKAGRGGDTLGDYGIVVQRNLFGVTAEPLGAEAASVAAQTSEVVSQASPGELSLLGTVAGGEVPLALVQVGSELLLVRLGETFAGGRTLEEVRRSEIVVRLRNGSLVMVPLQEASASTPSAAPVRRGVLSAGSANYQVESLGENRWRIPRQQAERARTNLNALLKTARMTPNIVDGRTEGFLVVTVQPRSLLSQMGLRPRDVLMEINGVQLDSPEKALQIFYQLREARSLALSLVRNGQPLTFNYVVE